MVIPSVFNSIVWCSSSLFMCGVMHGIAAAAWGGGIAVVAKRKWTGTGEDGDQTNGYHFQTGADHHPDSACSSCYNSLIIPSFLMSLQWKYFLLLLLLFLPFWKGGPQTGLAAKLLLIRRLKSHVLGVAWWRWSRNAVHTYIYIYVFRLLVEG